MSSHLAVWTLGVEEEYQLIDLTSRALRSDADAVLSAISTIPDIQVVAEFQQCQLEMATPICYSLADARRELLRARQVLSTAASSLGLGIAALATHPFSPWSEQRLANKERYYKILQDYQQLAREQVIFGCHVHVGYDDSERAVQIMNWARLWLAPLLALSANSPFWLGVDTGYQSYRTEIWWRWPAAGPPPYFPTRAAYREQIQALAATGSILDPTAIYWDIRLSERFPTIEFRVTDVCLTVDEAIMIAGLVRALVQTCHEQELAGIPYPKPTTELLRSAQWRAARFGLQGGLFDVNLGRILPAHDSIASLLDFVRPALIASGDWDEISRQVAFTLHHGNGASRQRAIYQERQSFADVVDFVLQETSYGIS